MVLDCFLGGFGDSLDGFLDVFGMVFGGLCIWHDFLDLRMPKSVVYLSFRFMQYTALGNEGTKSPQDAIKLSTLQWAPKL